MKVYCKNCNRATTNHLCHIPLKGSYTTEYYLADFKEYNHDGNCPYYRKGLTFVQIIWIISAIVFVLSTILGMIGILK